MTILKAENITAGYTEVDILHDVGIKVKSGEIVSIIGPNGAGKSTLLKTIFGLLKPRHGSVTLKEENITGLTPDKIVKKGISYVPQVENVFPSMTIQENLEMGAFIRDDDYSQRLDEIYNLFTVLRERKKQKVGHLSGGQRQMVAMGRALMLDPQVLLLDEPSAGLDPISARNLDELILELRESLGATVVVVTHELASIFTIGNNSVFLDADIRTMTAVGDPKKLRDESPGLKIRTFLTRGEVVNHGQTGQ